LAGHSKLVRKFSYAVSGSPPLENNIFLLLETVAPIQRQAVQPFGAGIGRFHEPQGSGFFSKNEEANDV
jgi:hypothetical protein